MSTPSATSAGSWSLQEIWAQVTPYVAPLVAASAGIAATLQGFVIKSAQQQGLPVPHVTIAEALKGGVRAAPKIGGIVGFQMIAQNETEKAVTGGAEKAGFAAMLASSTLVGAVFSFPLAIFQGQTMTPKLSTKQVYQAFSLPQALAITAREASFVFALRFSGPAGELMKQSCGEGKAVEYGSAFVSGAIASIVGHPGDTIATRLPKGMKIEVLGLMKGAPIKAVATGAFAVLYKIVKEAIESTAK